MCRNQHDPHKYEEFVKTTITNLSAFWIFLFVCLFVWFVCSVVCCLFVCLFFLFLCPLLFFFCSVLLSVLCLFLYFVYFVSYWLFRLFVCFILSFFAFFLYMCLVSAETDLIMFLLYQLNSSYVHETWNWC